MALMLVGGVVPAQAQPAAPSPRPSVPTDLETRDGRSWSSSALRRDELRGSQAARDSRIWSTRDQDDLRPALERPVQDWRGTGPADFDWQGRPRCERVLVQTPAGERVIILSELVCEGTEGIVPVPSSERVEDVRPRYPAP
jgi:hypothetical protein